MKRLGELRRELGLTQQQVADSVGIQRELYTRYESGMRKPSFEKLIAMADFFNVSVDYLLERTDIPELYIYDEGSGEARAEVRTTKKDLSPELQEQIRNRKRAPKKIRIPDGWMPSSREEFEQLVRKLVEDALDNS